MTAIQHVNSITWLPTSNPAGPVALIELDFNTYDEIQITPFGTYPDVGNSLRARGFTIDNIANDTGLTIIVGPVTYNILPYTRSSYPLTPIGATVVQVFGEVVNNPQLYFWIDPNTPGADTTNLFGVNQLALSTFLNSYTASCVDVTLAANPTDVFIFRGGATKTVYVNRIQLAVYTSAAITEQPIQIVKRRTAFAGGTSTQLTSVPLDSDFPAADAKAFSFTANPVVGILVGAVKSAFLSEAEVAGGVMNFSFDFVGRSAQTLILNGQAEQLAVNLGGVTVAGGKLACSVDWYEL